MSITPERLEEIRDRARNHRIKTQMESNGIILSLLNALEEAQKQLFMANGLASNYEYAKRECIKWNDEAVRLRGELVESQQQCQVERNVSAGYHRELVGAKQTIARQREALEESEALFHAITETSGSGFAVSNATAGLKLIQAALGEGAKESSSALCLHCGSKNTIDHPSRSDIRLCVPCDKIYSVFEGGERSNVD